MTRRSKREIERAVENLDADPEKGDTLRVVIRRNAVDENGDVVDTNETTVEM